MVCRNGFILAAGVFLKVLLFNGLAFSGEPPPLLDAGVLVNTIQEEESLYPEATEGWDKRDSVSLKTDSAEGPKVFIREFELLNYNIVSKDELALLMRDLEGRELTMTELNVACSRITSRYHNKGLILSKAYLPEQDLTEGKVQIAVRETRFGQIQVRGAKRIPKNWYQDYFSSLEEQDFNYYELLKKMITINDLPHIEARSTLIPGVVPQSTDLEIEVTESSPWGMSWSLNNWGSPLVSKYRSDLSLLKSSTFVPGDIIEGRFLGGFPLDSLSYWALDYETSTPINSLRMALKTSGSQYEVTEDYDILDPEGDSQSYALELFLPLYGDLGQKLILKAGLEYKSLYNELLGEEISNDELRIAYIGVDRDKADHFRGRNLYGFSVRQGIAGLWGGLEKEDAKGSRVGGGGDFLSIQFDYSRIQGLLKDQFLLWRSSFQWSDDLLPSSEQFALGGNHNLRGFYPASTLGDKGYSLSMEWRFPFFGLGNTSFFGGSGTWSDHFQFILFFDHGGVKKNDDESWERLSSCGLGGQVSLPWETYVSFSWGLPLSGEKENDPDSLCIFKITKRIL